MKLLDSGGLSILVAPIVVQERPFVTSVSQTDLTVGALALVVGTPAGGISATLFDLQNLSAAGQQIRVGLGVIPVFATTGKLLNPGDNFSIVLGSTLAGTGNVQAIASAAGAVLGRSIIAT
jgi:hypothetical protein